jgi:SH3 domain-containing YSC84-like protein 1
MPRSTLAHLSLLLLAMLAGPAVYAQSGSANSNVAPANATPANAAPANAGAQAASDAIAAAQMRVDDAIPVVEKMKTDPQVNELLAKAKGVFIVPHYLQAALVFGGRGGSGVMLVHRDANWTDPAFYNIGGGTFGAQIGGTKGALVLLLMSDKAVDAFGNKASTWSMSAGAGLTAVNYSKQVPESGTLSDVVVWSDTKGLFGGATVGASKVSRDAKANQVYYNNPDVTAQQILAGAVTNPKAKPLIDAMPLEQQSQQASKQ